MEGQDLSGAFTTEGLNLQHAVLAQSGLSGDVSLELNQQVSLADIKGLPLNQTIDSHSQVYNIMILHVNRVFSQVTTNEICLDSRPETLDMSHLWGGAD